MTEELRESLKKSRKESELNTIESQIRGLETRLKYNKSDLVATVIIYLIFVLLLHCLSRLMLLRFDKYFSSLQKKQITELEVELQGLQSELDKFGASIN